MCFKVHPICNFGHVLTTTFEDCPLKPMGPPICQPTPHTVFVARFPIKEGMTIKQNGQIIATVTQDCWEVEVDLDIWKELTKEVWKGHCPFCVDDGKSVQDLAESFRHTKLGAEDMDALEDNMMDADI